MYDQIITWRILVELFRTFFTEHYPGLMRVSAVGVMTDLAVAEIKDMVAVEGCDIAPDSVINIGDDFSVHGCTLDGLSNVLIDVTHNAADIETFSMDSNSHVAIAKRGELF